MSSIRRDDFDRPRALYAVVGLVLLFLFTPSVVVIVYSFNSSASLISFGGLSLRWYNQAAASSPLRESFLMSVKVALVSTCLATLLGTALAIGLERGRRTLARLSFAQVSLRLLVPETAVAAALFLLVTRVGVTLSPTTIVIGHVALCLPFVTVVVRSQLAGLSFDTEEAAMDLGATRLGSLRLVVLPAVWPAILAAAALAFVLSFDNFITSLFMTGTNTPTLPLSIYSMLRFGVTPVVNVLGVFMVLVSGALVTTAYLLIRIGRRASQARSAT